VNFRGPIEEIVERVAARAGDQHDAAVRVESQEFPIDPRIFPAGIVDELPAMDVMKDQVLRGLEESGGGVRWASVVGLHRFQRATLHRRNAPAVQTAIVSFG